MFNQQHHYYRWYLLFLIVTVGVVTGGVYLSLPSNTIRVWALNVGQGDALFIETPQHMQVLIDGGPSNAVLSELSQVMPFYDRTIDLVVLTHPQEDHLFGLIDVLKRYKVRYVLMTGIAYENGGSYAI